MACRTFAAFVGGRSRASGYHHAADRAGVKRKCDQPLPYCDKLVPKITESISFRITAIRANVLIVQSVTTHQAELALFVLVMQQK